MRRFGAGNSLHKPGSSTWRGWAKAMVLVLAPVAPAFGGQFAEVEAFISPATAVAMVYAPARQALVIKDFGSAIATINLATHASTSHPALKSFTDMALSPSGDFVYAADYGGENWSFQPPTNISYVHRLDLSNSTWETKTAWVADNIQVLLDSQFFLTSQDQWISFTFNDWGAGPVGAIMGTGSVRVGFLTGDVNQNRVVSISDLGLIRAQLSQPVTSVNFLRDLNANGAITVSDLGMANASLTHALPPP